MTLEHSHIVIKLGGQFFDLLDTNIEVCTNFFKFVYNLKEDGNKVVIVHGGGNHIQDSLSKLGRKSKKINGLRVTSKEDMDIVVGVLAGQLNKKLASKLQTFGLNSIGISLSDSSLAICACPNKELGRVGVPQSGKADILHHLFATDHIPVIASIGKDESGELCNVNADHAAIHVAKLLCAKIIYLSEVPGVLDKGKSLIKRLNSIEIKQLIEQRVITDGMQLKVISALEAATNIGQDAVIASWHSLENVKTLSEVGTCIAAD